MTHRAEEELEAERTAKPNTRQTKLGLRRNQISHWNGYQVIVLLTFKV